MDNSWFISTTHIKFGKKMYCEMSHWKHVKQHSAALYSETCITYIYFIKSHICDLIIALSHITNFSFISIQSSRHILSCAVLPIHMWWLGWPSPVRGSGVPEHPSCYWPGRTTCPLFLERSSGSRWWSWGHPGQDPAHWPDSPSAELRTKRLDDSRSTGRTERSRKYINHYT